jgi:hypothetical protein
MKWYWSTYPEQYEKHKKYLKINNDKHKKL